MLKATSARARKRKRRRLANPKKAKAEARPKATKGEEVRSTAHLWLPNDGASLANHRSSSCIQEAKNW